MRQNEETALISSGTAQILLGQSPATVMQRRCYRAGVQVGRIGSLSAVRSSETCNEEGCEVLGAACLLGEPRSEPNVWTADEMDPSEAYQYAGKL